MKRDLFTISTSVFISIVVSGIYILLYVWKLQSIPSHVIGVDREFSVNIRSLAQELGWNKHGRLRSVVADSCELLDADILQLESLEELDTLSLAQCRIDDQKATRILNIKILIALRLEGNCVSAIGIRRRSGKSKLRFLDLSYTCVKDDLVGELANFPELETLVLTGTNVSNSAIDEIRREYGVRVLH